MIYSYIALGRLAHYFHNCLRPLHTPYETLSLNAEHEAYLSFYLPQRYTPKIRPGPATERFHHALAGGHIRGNLS